MSTAINPYAPRPDDYDDDEYYEEVIEEEDVESDEYILEVEAEDDEFTEISVEVDDEPTVSDLQQAMIRSKEARSDVRLQSARAEAAKANHEALLEKRRSLEAQLESVRLAQQVELARISEQAAGKEESGRQAAEEKHVAKKAELHKQNGAIQFKICAEAAAARTAEAELLEAQQAKETAKKKKAEEDARIKDKINTVKETQAKTQASTQNAESATRNSIVSTSNNSEQRPTSTSKPVAKEEAPSPKRRGIFFRLFRRQKSSDSKNFAKDSKSPRKGKKKAEPSSGPKTQTSVRAVPAKDASPEQSRKAPTVASNRTVSKPFTPQTLANATSLPAPMSVEKAAPPKVETRTIVAPVASASSSVDIAVAPPRSAPAPIESGARHPLAVSIPRSTEPELVAAATNVPAAPVHTAVTSPPPRPTAIPAIPAETPSAPEPAEEAILQYYSLEELRTMSVPGLDYPNREKYLSPCDFQELFGCPIEEFSKLPKWKQTKAKRDAKLF